MGEEILTFDQRRVVEKTKFTYSLSGKALENKQKQLKIKEKKQIKAIEEHGKQLVESNTSVKNDYDRENDYDSKKYNYLLRKKKYLISLLMKGLMR